jgi:hypothetical protein
VPAIVVVGEVLMWRGEREKAQFFLKKVLERDGK